MQNIVNTVIGEISGAARYKWPAMLLAWTICLLGWAVVMALPSVYESRARIYADARTALSPVIKDLAIQQDLQAQLNLVQQNLLSEAQLDQIIDDTDLGAEAHSEEERAEVMDKLRDEILISVQPSGDYRNPGGSIFSIAYRDPDRMRSLEVVEILVDSFLEGTEGGSRENSEAAQTFLAQQISENEVQLREAEQRLAEFKKKNVGIMPGAEGDYFTRLQTEIDASREARSALSVAISQRDELNRQLRAGASAAAGSSALTTPVTADGRPASARDTAGRLVEAEQKLKDLLTVYTDKHPEVGILEAEIAELQQRRNRELEALRQGDPEAVVSTGASANPVYQSIQLALNQANLQIASLRGEIAQRDRKIAELRKVVQTVPEVEAELSRLNRDYDVTKAQYLALLERMEQAKLGQSAEATKSGVILEVLDPPMASFEPVAPRRPVLISLVLLAGIGAGAALAYLLSKLNPVFVHSRDLEKITGHEVLGVVSLTTFETYQAAAKKAYYRYAALAVALLLTFLVVLIFSQRVRDLIAAA